MKPTWTKALMIWCPIAFVLAVGAILSESIGRGWFSGLLLLPPRILSCFAEVWIWGFRPAPFDWFHTAIAAIYWPLFLMPLLGWIKTRSRYLLILEGVLLLGHIGIVVVLLLAHPFPCPN